MFEASQDDDIDAQLEAERLKAEGLEHKAKRQRKLNELQQLKTKNAALEQQVRNLRVVPLVFSSRSCCVCVESVPGLGPVKALEMRGRPDLHSFRSGGFKP